MSLTKNLARLGIEAALGLLVAYTISMVSMAAFFSWAGQVNPPLADQLALMLPPLAIIVALARFIWRASTNHRGTTATAKR